MPILRLWFDVETELRQDFRLTRRAMHSLQRLLHREQDHGWGNELEVLIYTYWLAHGLSYRVVARVFNVPKATVHDIIHRVAQNIWDNLRRAIDFPQTVDLPAVGQGFVNISGAVFTPQDGIPQQAKSSWVMVGIPVWKLRLASSPHSRSQCMEKYNSDSTTTSQGGAA